MPHVLWMTGLSGAGKTTLCQAVAERLRARGLKTIVLDGDMMRMGLCADLGFSTEDRIESVRRIAHTAKLFADQQIVVLVAVMAPINAARELARSIIPGLIQVYVNAPLDVCENRDVKGLYAKARRGELSGFTGIDAPFDPPHDAHIVCHTERESIEECVGRILAMTGIAPSEDLLATRSPRRKTIAVDFDGVISNYEGWQGLDVFGAPREDVKNALRDLRGDGWKIIVHTTRGFNAIRAYLLKEDIPFDEVNRNSDYANEGPKPVATVYWDDRAIRYSGDACKDLAAIRKFRTWSGRS